MTGETRACACTDGRTGAQVCGSDGTYESCVCSGAADAGSISFDDAGRGDDAGGRPDAGPPAPLRVFVTRLSYLPTAVQTVCQNAADAAELGGTWTPWISFAFSGGDSPAIDRIGGAGPWVLLDGQTAFRNRGQLGTAPDVPINVTELGTVLETGGVWTGTLTGGSTSDFTCQAWNENSEPFGGTVGSATSTENWTDLTSVDCDNERHVYCFEQ